MSGETAQLQRDLTLVLLSAGASVEAGISITRDLTAAVVAASSHRDKVLSVDDRKHAEWAGSR